MGKVGNEGDASALAAQVVVGTKDKASLGPLRGGLVSAWSVG